MQVLLSRVLRSSPLSSSFVFFSPDLLSLMPLLLYNQNDNTHYLREPKLEYLCIVHKSNCNLLQVTTTTTTTTTTNVYIKDEKEESKWKKIDHFRQGSLCNNRNDTFENIIKVRILNWNQYVGVKVPLWIPYWGQSYRYQVL